MSSVLPLSDLGGASSYCVNINGCMVRHHLQIMYREYYDICMHEGLRIPFIDVVDDVS